MSRLAIAAPRLAPTLLVGLWTPPKQRISSARTSGRRVAALLKQAPLTPGSINADLGGGAFDLGTQFLRTRSITNIIFDPFNRTPAENELAVVRLADGQAHSVTVANVLCVIREPSARLQLIRQAANVIGDHPARRAFFSVYCDRSKLPGLTPYGWQEHRPLATYVPELEVVFREVTQRGDFLIARHPRPRRQRASRHL